MSYGLIWPGSHKCVSKLRASNLILGVCLHVPAVCDHEKKDCLWWPWARSSSTRERLGLLVRGQKGVGKCGSLVLSGLL